MKGFIAVTDRDWYRFLSRNSEVDEVNFWQPSGKNEFGAVEVGEPILFKLHYPENAIVGAGFFTWFAIQPSRIAWESFGEKNGAPSYEVMRSRVERYRRVKSDPHAEYNLGCVVLRDVFFLAESAWVRPPSDFQKNIVRGKTYDLAIGEGARVWEELLMRAPVRERQLSDVDRPAMFGPPTLVRRRLGQGTFRTLVIEAYDKKCAVTSEKTLLVLDAAHIRPVAAGGFHEIGNGILLRSDLHTLFDRGYITVDPERRLRVSGRLKKDFDNGEHYRALEGNRLRVPRLREFLPDSDLLEWHNDSIFLG